eukprot:FR737500.1.p3 GENE.FR737500.1~~FR737500.1.p3  ORF type:complete len:102 (-),score=27.27 FR737500.1:916-1221(-)
MREVFFLSGVLKVFEGVLRVFVALFGVGAIGIFFGGRGGGGPFLCHPIAGKNLSWGVAPFGPPEKVLGKVGGKNFWSRGGGKDGTTAGCSNFGGFPGPGPL